MLNPNFPQELLKMSLVPVLYKSQYLQPAADCGSIKLDASFEKFFTNLVVASLRPLRQVAMEAERAIEQLTVKQVVAWFEKDGKIRRELGTDAAFLDL